MNPCPSVIGGVYLMCDRCPDCKHVMAVHGHDRVCDICGIIELVYQPNHLMQAFEKRKKR